MNLISRREMLNVGLVGSALTFTTHASASASSTSNPNPKAADPVYSPILEKFANDALGDMIVRTEAGSVNSQDLLHAGKALRLVARNMHAQYIDAYVRVAASKIDETQTDLALDKLLIPMHAKLRDKGSNTSFADLKSSYRYTQDTVKTAKRNLMEQGLSWHLHWVADKMYEVSRLTASSVRSAEIKNVPRQHHASLQMAVMTWHTEAHYQTVQSTPGAGGACKKAVCDALKDSDTRTAIAAGIALGLRAFGPTAANAFCASDVVLSIAADIVTAGTGVVATVAEAALCAGAQAAAQYAASPGGAIANTLLAKKGLESVATALGC